MNASIGGLVNRRNVSMKSIVKPSEESPRSRVRCKEEFTADELALLQAKLEGWIRAVATKSESKRPRHQFVIKFKNTGRE
jgi:hypothetical protein